MKFILIVAAGLVLSLSACKKDEGKNDCQQLEGSWSASSWLEDNEQFFGDTIYIVSSIIQFDKLESMQGDFTWTLDYTLGGEVTIIGAYEVNESCDEITITPKAGVGTTYTFTIEGDNLSLETHDNNVHVVQEYQRN